jgi:proline iminopeptidase
MMCQKYAITYPDSIRGMILLSTAASAKLFETHADVLRSSGTPEQLEMYEKYFKPGKFPDNETYAKYYRVLADKYNVDLKTQEEWKTHFDRIILSYEAANACFANEAYSFDFTPDLHKVKCPALVIGAEEDWITPIGCTHEIVAHLPDAKEYVAAASHEVFEDKSIYSVMIEFIKERL